MKLSFIRHGQTNYNVKDLCNYDPTKDVHLTDLGKKQAKIAAEKIRDKNFDIIFISELPRTRETADIINIYHQVPIKIFKDINDRNSGFESKPVAEFNKAIEKDKFNLKLNNGESFQEEKERIFNFLESLKRLSYNSILIVSHMETMQIINGYFNNLNDKEIWNIKIDNCQILEFSI